ncbi:hypothetical protein CAGA_08320 [Caproiciproducens galactitolivorans]|uniref:Uncharacterized protein n=1 Tax=Caproiciproducens galactitolivorans TaxID=642589 RepID=A0A4Z0YL03_9FIRM|nr:hypothetical protein CAGA_08320 [Caproiciproducens galactitolivorans]
MKYIGKIISYPTKLFVNNRIYIPKEYLHFYGISEINDELFFKTSDRQLFYQPSYLCRKEAIHTSLAPLLGDWLLYLFRGLENTG